MDKFLKALKDKFPLSRNLVVGVFFLFLLFIGIFNHKDYGISWDEPIGKSNGAISALYANHKLNYLLLSEEKVDQLTDKFINKDESRNQFKDPNFIKTYKDKDYGVIFEFYLAGVQFLTNTTDEQAIYQQRHLFTFLFFFIGVFIFYFIGLEVFKNWKLALLACLFLILSPRIFAHSFYNSKDIPFLSVYIWTLYSMLKFLKEKNIKWAILHAFTTAILIAIRIPGIIIPVMTLLFLVLDEFSGSHLKKLKKQRWSSYIIYYITSSGLILLFWPYLWENPLGNFIDAFHNFSRFRSDTYLLFWGELIWTKDLPWYYTLSWMLITIPVLYTLLFLTGCIFLIKDVFKKIKDWSFYSCETTRSKLLIVTTFIGPLMAILIFNSVLYNGWRHSYFIYPSMLIIATFALAEIISYSKQKMGTLGKNIMLIIIMIYVSYMTYTNYRLHPYQQDYFNFLVGTSIEENFDIDYWGLAYKEGLNYLIKKEGTNPFSVGAHITYPVTLNTNMFTKDQRDKIKVNNIDYKSDYLFIKSDERYKFSKIKTYDFSGYEKIKVISAGELPLLEIYKAKRNAR